MSEYDKNIDSKEPFLKDNHVVNNSCPSSSTSSNNSTNTCNGLMAGAKTPNKDTEYQALQATIAKLRTWLIAITAVAIIGFVILISVVTCLYTQLNYDLTHHTHKPKVGEQMAAILEREELCVPCEEFRLGPSPEEDSLLKRFNIRDTPNGANCCVDQPLQLLELLKLVSKCVGVLFFIDMWS